jgi:hypothetical protein
MVREDCAVMRGEGQKIGTDRVGLRVQAGARQNLPSDDDEAVRSNHAMMRRDEMERCGRWS